MMVHVVGNNSALTGHLYHIKFMDACTQITYSRLQLYSHALTNALRAKLYLRRNGLQLVTCCQGSSMGIAYHAGKKVAQQYMKLIKMWNCIVFCVICLYMTLIRLSGILRSTSPITLKLFCDMEAWNSVLTPSTNVAPPTKVRAVAATSLNQLQSELLVVLTKLSLKNAADIRLLCSMRD